jgi:hypothetical protein
LKNYVFSDEFKKNNYIDLNDQKFNLAAVPTANQFREELHKVFAFCSVKLALLKAKCLQGVENIYEQAVKL